MWEHSNSHRTRSSRPFPRRLPKLIVVRSREEAAEDAASAGAGKSGGKLYYSILYHAMLYYTVEPSRRGIQEDVTPPEALILATIQQSGIHILHGVSNHRPQRACHASQVACDCLRKWHGQVSPPHANHQRLIAAKAFRRRLAIKATALPLAVQIVQGGRPPEAVGSPREPQCHLRNQNKRIQIQPTNELNSPK